MLEELRRVLPYIDPGNSRADISRLVVKQNFLHRPSLASRKAIDKKLSERYFRRDQPNSSAEFVRSARLANDQPTLALLAYAMLLWNDGLSFLLGIEWLAPKLVGAGYEAETDDIIRQLDLVAQKQKHVAGWSTITKQRVARHYLSMLRDCGFAVGGATKVIKKPFVPPDVVLFASKLILGGGEPKRTIPENKLFTAMGLESTKSWTNSMNWTGEACCSSLRKAD